MLSGLVFVGVVLILQLYFLIGRLGDIHSEIKDVKEQLSWTKQSSFAEYLQDWIEELSKNITEKIEQSSEEISRDVTHEIKHVASDIGISLSNIENNTSRRN